MQCDTQFDLSNSVNDFDMGNINYGGKKDLDIKTLPYKFLTDLPQPLSNSYISRKWHCRLNLAIL